MTHPIFEKLAELEHRKWCDAVNRIVEACRVAVACRSDPNTAEQLLADLTIREWLRLARTPFEDLTPEQQRGDRENAQRIVSLLAPYFAELHQEAVSGSLERAKELAGPLRLELDAEQLLKLRQAVREAKAGPTHAIVVPEDDELVMLERKRCLRLLEARIKTLESAKARYEPNHPQHAYIHGSIQHLQQVLRMVSSGAEL